MKRPRVPKMSLDSGFDIRYKQVPYDDRYFFLYSKGLANGGPAGEQFKVPRNLVLQRGIENIFHAFLDGYAPDYRARMVEAFEARVKKADDWLDAHPDGGV